LENIRDHISNKILNKEESLNKEEQTILKEEFKLTKIKIALHKFFLFMILLVEIIFFIYIAFRANQVLSNISGSENISNKEIVAVIDLDKPITDNYADKFISKFINIYNKDNVKSIVIRLRSPGGTPSASWNIATTLKDLQEKNKKPIYTYVDSAAVSGSYMIASQSNKIFANEFAMVGSIGVIMEHLVFEELSKKLGIGQETLTAGKYKKMISSFSYLKESDKNRIQNTILNVVYNNFIKVVANGRHKSIDTIKKYAEGKVFIANDKSIQGILVDSVLTWPNMKKEIIKENKFDKDIQFIRINNKKDDISLLKNILGTSFDLNLNLNLDNNYLSNLK